MKVNVLRTFDWNPERYHGQVTVVIKPGVQQVTRECAAKAIAAGAAELVRTDDGDTGGQS